MSEGLCKNKNSQAEYIPYDASEDKHIATQGRRIVIDFRVNDLLIGEEGVCTGEPV